MDGQPNRQADTQTDQQTHKRYMGIQHKYIGLGLGLICNAKANAKTKATATAKGKGEVRQFLDNSEEFLLSYPKLKQRQCVLCAKPLDVALSWSCSCSCKAIFSYFIFNWISLIFNPHSTRPCSCPIPLTLTLLTYLSNANLPYPISLPIPHPNSKVTL
jgi:hypothetical protein